MNLTGRISMNLTQDQLIDIIHHEENIKAKIKVTTKYSSFNGTIYNVHSMRYNKSVSIKRNNRTVYYQHGSYELCEDSINEFKKLTKSINTVDFFKKSIDINDILYNDGRLYKVLFFSDKNVYIQVVNEGKYWDGQYESPNYYEVGGSRNRDESNNGKIYKLASDEMLIFIRIDDPLDLLAI